MAHSDCGWTGGCAGKTVKSLENTCHTWALLRWWFTTKRRYIKCMHLYLTFTADDLYDGLRRQFGVCLWLLTGEGLEYYWRDGTSSWPVCCSLPWHVIDYVMYCRLFNLPKLEETEPIFIIIDILCMLKVVASKCMHDFPAHLRCDLALPGNTLVAEYARCIPSWTHKNCTAFRRLC